MSTLSLKLSRRNITLDVVKLFAAYCVVFIHNNFYGNFGAVVDALARFAVPLFFVTSGYFCFNNDVEKIKKKILHIVKLFVFATVFYHLVNIVLFLLQSDIAGVKDYLLQIVSLNAILNFVLFNEPVSSTHLWFLLALVYSYLIQLLIVKCRVPMKLVYILSSVALLVHLFLGEGLSVMSYTIPVIYVRNFLLFGYPFFAFGMWMRQHRDKLTEIKSVWFVIFIVVGAVESALSVLAFGRNELFVGTVVIVFSLVVLALKYPDVKAFYVLAPFVSCSTYIYIFHQVVGKAINVLSKLVGVDTETVLFCNIKPVAVCIATTAVALLIVLVENKTKKKNQA